MPSISFFSEDTAFKLIHPDKTIDWIRNVIHSEGFELVNVNYVFCSDQYLHKINVEYLSHDTYTDILTFDQSENEKGIEGDVYISVERVEENARSLDDNFEQELHRVMIHGILHLMGFTDKTQEQKMVMREKEDSCLSLYFI